MNVHANRLQFNTGIKGNRFSGAQGGYQIEGGFFGPEAAEIAGGASNAAARKFFAFGAEKQK